MCLTNLQVHSIPTQITLFPPHPPLLQPQIQSLLYLQAPTITYIASHPPPMLQILQVHKITTIPPLKTSSVIAVTRGVTPTKQARIQHQLFTSPERIKRIHEISQPYMVLLKETDTYLSEGSTLPSEIQKVIIIPDSNHVLIVFSIPHY